jgi:hypothetical protein
MPGQPSYQLSILPSDLRQNKFFSYYVTEKLSQIVVYFNLSNDS